MKRSISIAEYQIYNGGPNSNSNCGKIKKKIRQDPVPETDAAAVLLDENLLYEILKNVDARTLGAVGCVNKQWHRTAQDERLWELICTKHSANIGFGNNQLRSVVLAFGGFRLLHSQYLWPLSKPSNSNTTGVESPAAWPCLPPPRTVVPAKPAAAKSRWGKDEVQLSLCLMSIRSYEKMNLINRK